MSVEASPAFYRQLAGAFRHPFQGDGLYVLFAGGVAFTIADYVSAYASVMGIMIQAAVAGYLMAYAKDVTRASAMGEEHPPGWADFSDWVSDLLAPALEGAIVVAVSFGGVIFLLFKHPPPTLAGQALWLAAGVWGCLSFPILFLALAMTDSLLALLNPIPLLQTVWLTLPHYLLVSLLCVLIIAAGMGAAKLEDLVSRIPIFPHFIGRLASIYLLTVLMRGIGLFYRHHHQRLQWY